MVRHGRRPAPNLSTMRPEAVGIRSIKRRLGGIVSRDYIIIYLKHLQLSSNIYRQLYQRNTISRGSGLEAPIGSAPQEPRAQPPPPPPTYMTHPPKYRAFYHPFAINNTVIRKYSWTVL